MTYMIAGRDRIAADEYNVSRNVAIHKNCEESMRLLKWINDREIGQTPDLHENRIPRFAILSHTWFDDGEEVTFADLQLGPAHCESKRGYQKIKFCGEQARKDSIDHFWVDTCCINKNSESELSKAIRSMFKWYHRAVKCYVYLSDVSTQDEFGYLDREEVELAFRNSRWFKRGWTLQELLAPRVVEFYTQEWINFGTKIDLIRYVHETTRIPLSALSGAPLNGFSIPERWNWARNRETKEVEDGAYCLVGIFDVNMSFRYGESQEAFRRLEEEIDRRWGYPFPSSLVEPSFTPLERVSGRPIPTNINFIPFSRRAEHLHRGLIYNHNKRPEELTPGAVRLMRNEMPPRQDYEASRTTRTSNLACQICSLAVGHEGKIHWCLQHQKFTHRDCSAHEQLWSCTQCNLIEIKICPNIVDISKACVVRAQSTGNKFRGLICDTCLTPICRSCLQIEEGLEELRKHCFEKQKHRRWVMKGAAPTVHEILRNLRV